MVGDRKFEIDWTSVYTFHCRRLKRFVHDSVIFVGDSAHVISPFGARGGNGGIQDVDNLCWKLAAVLKGKAAETMLETYNTERIHGSDENILNSSRSTTFMTPKSPFERMLRQSVLELAKDHVFARRMVNSGRLSLPCSYETCGTVATDDGTLPAITAPGRPAVDAPLGNGWLMNELGHAFTLLSIGGDAKPLEGVRHINLPVTSEISDRYLGDAKQAHYLIRPDQHVAARWILFDAQTVRQAKATWY
jgi:3-(3-hydroxy-phenyl)propionate hydroxylase